MAKRVKARGQHGSWFAEVAGERLPCIHMHWLKGMAYHDPNLFPGDPKGDELAAALEAKKKAILTDDDMVGTKPATFAFEGGAHKQERPAFARTRYRCIYEIEDLRYDKDGLRFRCTRKVVELED